MRRRFRRWATLSHEEAVEFENLLTEIERRMLATIGKYAVASLVSILALTITAAGAWFGQAARIGALETWKTDRAKPIEDYYEQQKADAEQRGRIEQTLKDLKEQLQDVKADLKRLDRK